MHATAPAPASGPTAGGRLHWDGQQWWLTQGALAQPGQPELVWDLDRACVLRWHGRGSRWLWLARRREPAGWHALRVALMHGREHERRPSQ